MSIHTHNTVSLDALLKRYQHIASIKACITKRTAALTKNALIALYHEAIPLIETQIWAHDRDASQLTQYQAVFHELEKLIDTASQATPRHHFIITIPVADRPQHLETCLQSILNLCRTYYYGGMHQGCFKKIQVLIADDSQHENNINKNQSMASQFTQQGLNVEYFGLNEQQALIKQLNQPVSKLHNIIGQYDNKPFFHKGAAITRNITYLKLKQLQRTDTPTLFYFIDSDQEFNVSFKTQLGDIKNTTLNYFYYLDRIFSTQDIHILTGKVVGDPPVSPSIMASNLIDDLIAFILKIAQHTPDTACFFNKNPTNTANDASYHDMAELFGFKSSTQKTPYCCPIPSQHNLNQCFDALSKKLQSFFDGEHPTRKSYFVYENALHSTKAARTIYTGNYIFKPHCLRYFIPFASLKLRMAGPVLGRIIASEIKEKFVSSNLPMQHNRTVATTGQAEYRSGVNHKNHHVDLSGEFIRQFFGDVMLFSMIALTEQGYPSTALTPENISDIIHQKIDFLREKYLSKRVEINDKVKHLSRLLNEPQHWWHDHEDLVCARDNFMHFIDNIMYNFSSQAKIYNIIQSKTHTEQYHNDILKAILAYSQDMTTWENIINPQQQKP